MMSGSIDHLLTQYGAGLVGLVVGLEAMGLPLPGESMVIAGALYCATTHRISIIWMLAASVTGAIMGDNCGYLVGRLLGYRLLARHGRRVGLTEDRLAFGRLLFERYGSVVVFLARFIAILRTFAALLAGANRMNWRRFLLWNALGGFCWASAYGLAAYFLGTEIRHLQGPVGICLAALLAVLVGAAIVFLRRNERRLMDEARSRAWR